MIHIFKTPRLNTMSGAREHCSIMYITDKLSLTKQTHKMFLAERTIDRIVQQLDQELDVKDLVSNEEYDILRKEFLLDETCDRLYVPAFFGGSYKITKLYTDEFDIMSFIDHIIETIPMPFEISLDVGFFTKHDVNNNLEYIKPSETQSLVSACIPTLEYYWRFSREIRQCQQNLRQEAWTNACDRGQIAGWTSPVTVTSLCIYIQKF